MYSRSHSPYGNPSPSLPNEVPNHYPQFNQVPMQQPQPQPNDIQPGSITYTTTSAPDGRQVYQPFKAVPASYQTPNGIVSGIQWVPIEATAVIPAGAQPATADFAAMWQRGGPGMTSQDERKIKDWQKSEEKRRRKEVKESQRALRDKDIYSPSSSSGHALPEDASLRKAREKDAQRAADRERRKSFTGNAPPFRSPTAQGTPSNPSTPFIPPGAPSPYSQPVNLGSSYGGGGGGGGGGGYPFPTTPGIAPGAYPPSGQGGSVHDLAGQMGGMDLAANREFEREKSPMARPKKYTSDNMSHRQSGNFGANGSQPYPPNPTTSPYPSFNSATAGGVGYPGGVGVGGQPMASNSGYPAFQSPPIDPSRSRTTTPAIGPGPLPGMGGYPSAIVGGMPVSPPEEQQLPAPEGFSRPPNQAQPYTPFEMIKIQDMDEFLDVIPRMPLVLQTHDTFHEDWIRLMQDISLAWAGRLPVPELSRSGRYPRRSTLTSDVIALWNLNFFQPRGIEMILYKGRERRSGPHKGVVDLEFPDDDYSDESTTTSSSSSESDSEDDGGGGGGGGVGGYGLTGGGYGAYGRQGQGQGYGGSADNMDARRRKREKKNERRRREKEKKQRRKERAREKKYALYVTCISPNPPLSTHSIPAPGAVAGYGAPY